MKNTQFPIYICVLIIFFFFWVLILSFSHYACLFNLKKKKFYHYQTARIKSTTHWPLVLGETCKQVGSTRLQTLSGHISRTSEAHDKIVDPQQTTAVNQTRGINKASCFVCLKISPPTPRAGQGRCRSPKFLGCWGGAQTLPRSGNCDTSALNSFILLILSGIKIEIPNS